MTDELRAAIRYVHENIIGCDSYDREDWEKLERVKVAAESWARLEWKHCSDRPAIGDGTFDVVARFRGESGWYATRLETIRWRTGKWLIAIERVGWAELADDCDFMWLSGSLPPVPTEATGG